MKAILEFTLPEDQDAFELAHKGGQMYQSLWEIEQVLRRYANDIDYYDRRTYGTGRKGRAPKHVAESVQHVLNQLSDELWEHLKARPEVA